MSLFVTLSNIVLIALSSMFMFRMKEVLPIEKKVFWTDLGTARKIYQRRALIKNPSSFLQDDRPTEYQDKEEEQSV
jgi:hypothetical protein